MFAASKSGRAGASTDSFFPYVPLLLETTSTNGQQNNTFLDSSTNNFTITRNGTPTQGSVTPYWPNGYWGNYFNGSTDYLVPTATTIANFGASDFTVELWLNLSALGSARCIMDARDSSNTSQMFFQIETDNKVKFGTQAAYLVASTTVLTTSTWYHVAVTRASGTVRLFINGSLEASASDATVYTQATNRPTIGVTGFILGNNFFFGYFSNIRIVKGQALSTVSFTPPVVPVNSSTVGWNGSSTALSGTVSLLTSQSNRFRDNSTNNFTLTATGTPRVQAFQPFSPVASYTTAAYGGSGYFSGTGGNSYLSSAGNASTAMSTGDFTWECWVYVVASTNYQDFIDTRSTPALGSADGFFWGLNNNTLTPIVYTTSVLLTSSINVALNGWTHVALTRSGTTLTIWVNGVSGGTATNSTNLSNQSFSIGSANTSSVQTNGYISNLRIVKGTPVYTGAFTPPTLAPLTTAGSTSAASYSSTTNVNTSFAASSTAYLANFTNAGIYDAAVQNDVITVGDAQSSTTQFKWSPTSMKYDGTGDWLTAIDSPQLQIGTGDFTIDGWVYLSAISVAYGIISKGTATTGWSVNVTALNKLQFSYTASNLTGTTSLATGTWYYFAVVRSGSATGNLKIYLNGTADATSGGAVTDNFNQTSILYVGADRIGTSALNGYLQDVRITKYARTITTPTAAFPTR
jgi:hypothetical protein